jgi:hypothetical protein
VPGYGGPKWSERLVMAALAVLLASWAIAEAVTRITAVLPALVVLVFLGAAGYAVARWCQRRSSGW